MKRTTHRKLSGQALVEGSAFLVFFSMVAVGVLLLLLCVGSVEFYHLKMQQIADTIARSVVANTFWEGNQFNPKPTALSSSQQALVQQLLADQGLPSGNGIWSVTIQDDSSGQNAIVTLSENALPIPGCGILPSFTSMSATATEPWSINYPPMTVLLATSVGPVFIPAYQPNNGTMNAPSQSADASATWGFNQNDIGSFGNLTSGLGQLGLNYAGYGSSNAASGEAPTFTPHAVTAFCPYNGSTTNLQPTAADYSSVSGM